MPRAAFGSDSIIKNWGDARRILGQGRYDYQSEIRSGYAPVVTGVVLMWEHKVYSFHVGAHTHFESIVGEKSIMLRKFLDEFDLDLFETDGTGITSSTARTALPVLSEGRRARLENGKLSKAERIQFFQVSALLTNKFARWSGSTNCFVLMSAIDLSTIYSTLPKTQRRMELNCASWRDVQSIRSTICDDDSLNFLSSTNIKGRGNEG